MTEAQAVGACFIILPFLIAALWYTPERWVPYLIPAVAGLGSISFGLLLVTGVIE